MGTSKNHATSWGKNVLKIQILVTIKLQEIGTGHLGLVYFLFFAQKPLGGGGREG